MKQVRKRKTNIALYCVYIESRKMVQMDLFAGQDRDTDIENGHVDKGWGVLG